ncbi:MAG: ATP-binding protein [Geminicoccaceae bacterium]|nr:ATP-binding protein [Geminicoccaceae bacterium]
MARGDIKVRDRNAIVGALRAGVVPRLGLQHVQVGRAREIEQIVKDIRNLSQGGSTVRFVIGDYGSGKTFFLNLARLVALETKLVTAHADLGPNQRLFASGGEARGLYAVLMTNLATRSKPEGGALTSIIERFIGEARRHAGTEDAVGDEIEKRLAVLQDMRAGYDFATVIRRYWEAFEAGDDRLKDAALRWLRGEYALKTQAKSDLGVRVIIDDDTVYDHLKLMSRFVRLAGYDGFLVVLDEMVNLHKLVNATSRNANYEQILRIVNDLLQGRAEHFGVLFGGTPEFLLDPRRGLYSYEALRSRLAENSFVKHGLVDFSGPVIRLPALTTEELYVLLTKLRHVFAQGNPDDYPVPDEALHAFMAHCQQKIGEAYFRTPRNTIKTFLDLLAVLDQNPGTAWDDLIERTEIAPDRGPLNADPKGAEGPATSDEGFAEFRL